MEICEIVNTLFLPCCIQFLSLAGKKKKRKKEETVTSSGKKRLSELTFGEAKDDRISVQAELNHKMT